MLTWEDLWKTPLKRKVAVARAQSMQADAVTKALGPVEILGGSKLWDVTEEIVSALRESEPAYRDLKNAADLCERLGVKLDIPAHILNEARRIEAADWGAVGSWKEDDKGEMTYHRNLDESLLVPREHPLDGNE